MIEVELLGAERPPGDRSAAPSSRGAGIPSVEEVRGLCVLAAGSAGVRDGHLAIEFVDERRITQLNGEFRNKPTPTDVLSFPVDGVEPGGGARELGDVIICLEHTSDVREAIVHGVLHLLGMDHESDDGEMLALQDELLGRADG
jgi:probable rRNA maturation factor